MSNLSLIPFGLRITDKQFVDVSEVDRGGNCQCICPSCKTPLIARQGTINEWHFAHASKGVSRKVEDKCQYSFWVSVVLMAKQVIESAASIKLPSLIMYTDAGKEINICSEKQISLDSVEIEKTIYSIPADAVLKVGGYEIAVIFSTPHKHFDHSIPATDGKNTVGVLEISLFDAYQWLFGSKNQGKYTEIIKGHILSGIQFKQWLYHPRVEVVKKEFNLKLYAENPDEASFWYPEIECEKESFIPIDDPQGEGESQVLETLSKTLEQPGKKHYKCVVCHKNWFGLVECEHCGTHLYSTEIESL